MRLTVIVLMIIAAAPVAAEPRDVPIGDPLRGVLLDVVRPIAEQVLGPPVLFEVIEIAVDGRRAFARLYGVRPDGGEIDLAQTPVVIEHGWSLDLFDGPRFEVFYHFDNGAWRVVEWEIGATDAWWFGYDCANYAQFYEPQACGG